MFSVENVLNIAKDSDKSYYNAMMSYLSGFNKSGDFEGVNPVVIKEIDDYTLVLHYGQYQTLLRVRDRKSNDYGLMFGDKNVVFVNTFNRIPKSDEELSEVLSLFDSNLIKSVKQGISLSSDLGDIHTFASEKAGKKASLIVWRSWNYRILYVR